MTLSDFPPLNASLNGLSTLLLATGWWFIRSGRRTAHRNCMIGAFVSSSVFLACYLWYHYQMQRLHGRAHTSFTDPAWFRPVYLAILVTHLVGAMVILPLIAMTFYRAFRKALLKLSLHRRTRRNSTRRRLLLHRRSTKPSLQR